MDVSETNFSATEFFESVHGFKPYAKFSLDNISGAMVCDMAKLSSVTGVYAIIVDNVLMYIGKSTDVSKRMGYYKTSWNRTTYHSDKKKSEAIFDCVLKGLEVLVMFLPVFKTTLTRSTEYRSGKIISEVVELIDYSTVEEKLIKQYQPDWNVALK